MIKAILFDIDGVLIRHDKWFFEVFAENYISSALSILSEFCFGSNIVECDRGKKDSYIEIKPFLSRIGYEGSIEEFFHIKNEYEKKGIDFSALSKIEKINKTKMKCFIGSNQDFRRKEVLISNLKLNEIVEEAYFSCDFGYVKPENEYWLCTHKRIEKIIENIRADEILFFDDRNENIESSIKYGFISIEVKNSKILHDKLDEI